MAVTFADDILGSPPAAPPARPRVLLIGTGFALVGIVLTFAGLFGIYVEQRAQVLNSGQKWLPKEVSIDLTQFNVALIGLAISVVIMHWAIWCVKHEDRPRAYIGLGLTALLGAAYINGICFAYTQMGFTVHDTTGVGVLVYAITGLHLAMVGAGIIFIGLMAFRTLGGQYSARDQEGLAAAALYWYVTCAVYTVIWYAIFVTK
ncbi:MAG TPA: cytochrome c oxidase subunit 3 [Acidimicrobiales bacterium]|nr:cytochrome c oxidase subunit 3 [Acidimicrobiales bacterium]